METIAKKLGNRADAEEPSSKRPKLGKFGTILASLALYGAAAMGCGDRSTVYNYYGQSDAGACDNTGTDGHAPGSGSASDAGNQKADQNDGGVDGAVPDAGNEDLDAGADASAQDADTCILPWGSAPACGDSAVGGIVNVGEMMPFGKLAVQLDDIEISDNGNSALVSVLQEDCFIIKKDKIREGQTVTIQVGADSYDITVNMIAAGYTFGAKWIDLDINAGGCDGDAGTPACSRSPGPELACGGQTISGILNQNEGFAFDGLSLWLDDLEAHGDVSNAIVSIQDMNCNVLKKDKIAEGQTKTFSINGKAYDVSVPSLAPGYTFGAKWASVEIAAGDCEAACEPMGECGASYDITVVTLGEGESTTISGITVALTEVTQDVGAASGETCPVSNENATLKLTQPGVETTATVAETGCQRTGDGCYSVKVLEISETVGAAVYPDGGVGTCPISNEKARLEIKTPQ